jgi:hypothetical protein
LPNAQPASDRAARSQGDAEQRVRRALKGTTGDVDVLGGADASATRALSLLVDAPPGSSLLIDNAWRPLSDETACRELDSHIRTCASAVSGSYPGAWPGGPATHPAARAALRLSVDVAYA